MAFVPLSRTGSAWILGGGHYTCSVGNGATGSNAYYGKTMGSCSFTNGWKPRAVSDGRETLMR